MNNKGQTLGIAIMGALFIFIIGMATINLLMPEVTQFRVDMNCSSAATISDGTKLLCLVGDTTIIYFILLIFSISIGGIIAHFTL